MSDPETPSSLSPRDDPAGPRAAWTAWGPWRFLGAALPGGASRRGLQLTAAWMGFALVPQLLWSLHLSSLTGWSALPSYWGEMLTGRDVWELGVNGGLAQHATGPWTPLAAGLGLLWILWAGWRLQAERIGVPAHFGPWGWGLADALLIAVPPLALLAAVLLGGLAFLGATGRPALVWLQWAGTAVLLPVLISTFCLQWWLCRLARAEAAPGFRLGSWRALRRHLGLGFGRLWRHPGQWLALVLAGVALRSGLTLLVLTLAWRLGGGGLLRVALFLGLQLAAVAANAWLLGWFLRLTALFLRHQAGAGGGAELETVPEGLLG